MQLLSRRDPSLPRGGGVVDSLGPLRFSANFTMIVLLCEQYSLYIPIDKSLIFGVSFEFSPQVGW